MKKKSHPTFFGTYTSARILSFCLPLAAVLLATTPAKSAPQSGTVTVAVGSVTVTPAAGGTAVALKAGDTVAVGSTVKTGADSRAVIVMTATSAIRIAADTEILIQEVDEAAENPKVLLDIKSGSVGALLKPKEGKALDFKIKTPSGVAAARGTFFAVVVENGKGFAQVKEGKVEIIPSKEGN